MQPSWQEGAACGLHEENRRGAWARGSVRGTLHSTIRCARPASMLPGWLRAAALPSMPWAQGARGGAAEALAAPLEVPTSPPHRGAGGSFGTVRANPGAGVVYAACCATASARGKGHEAGRGMQVGGVGGNQSVARARRARCARGEEQELRSTGEGGRKQEPFVAGSESRGWDEPEPLPAAWLSTAALAFYTVCSGGARRVDEAPAARQASRAPPPLPRAGRCSIFKVHTCSVCCRSAEWRSLGRGAWRQEPV